MRPETDARDTSLVDRVMNECHFADEALREAFRLGALAATRVIREELFG